jgi:hypothetical protein
MSPAEPALSAVLRRDRIVALIALALLTLLAWAYLVWTHDRMNAMPNVPGMDDLPGMVMQPMAWTATQTALTFAMWAIMMVAMMLPSAAPMVLTYMQVARTANSVPFASALWFAGGYLLAWFGFSLVATRRPVPARPGDATDADAGTEQQGIYRRAADPGGALSVDVAQGHLSHKTVAPQSRSCRSMAVSGLRRRPRCALARSTASTASAAAGS